MALALMRAILGDIFTTVLPQLAPGPAVTRSIEVRPQHLRVAERWFARERLGRVRLVAIGKAAGPMLHAAWDALAGVANLSALAIAPEPIADLPAGARGVVGGHPHPDAASRRAADAVFDLLADGRADDLVIDLLSGGGSALCEAPLALPGRPAIAQADTRAFYAALVGSGLDIVRMNAVRKHASALKGGRLALHAAPAAQVTLLVSDVPRGHADAIASGPTMPDPTTIADGRAALDATALWPRLPASYEALLRDPQLPETPKPGDPRFAACSWHTLLDAEVALAATQAQCAARGFVTEVDLSVDDAPLAVAGTNLLTRLRALKAAHPAHPVAVLTAGELSCPVTGPGVGGRNQHFALWCAQQIEGEPIAVLSAGTDGRDGNSPAAGAVADGTTMTRARALGLDPRGRFAACDAFGVFAPLGDALVTGATGTNLRDLRILAM
jgi:glycerate 2-kinase